MVAIVENNTDNSTNNSEMKKSEERSKNNNNNNIIISTSNQTNANKNIGINNQCKSTYFDNKILENILTCNKYIWSTNRIMDSRFSASYYNEFPCFLCMFIKVVFKSSYKKSSDWRNFICYFFYIY